MQRSYVSMGKMVVSSVVPASRFQAHDDPINHIAFDRSGLLMATADTAMKVKVWRAPDLIQSYDLRSMHEKVRPTERIRGLKFAPEGSILYVAAGDHVYTFDIEAANTTPVWSYASPRLLAFLIVSPTSISVSSRGTLAATFDNGMLVAWNADGSQSAVIRHNAVPRSALFLPDESLVGSDGFSTSCWSLDKRRPIWHRTSTERIYGTSASADGRYLAVRRLYTTAISEMDTGKTAAEYRQGRGLPLIAFGTRSNHLAIGTQHAIHLCHPTRGDSTALPLEDAELVALGFDHNGAAVAGCSDGSVRKWTIDLTNDPPETGS